MWQHKAGQERKDWDPIRGAELLELVSDTMYHEMSASELRWPWGYNLKKDGKAKQS